jgi:hypothetical protein
VVEGEKKRKEKESELNPFRMLTPQDIASALDQLKVVVDYVLLTVSDLEKSVRKLSRKTKSSTSDILFFLFFLALMLRAPQAPVQAPASAARTNTSASVSVEKIQKILRECRKSANPIECVENQLFGG